MKTDTMSSYMLREEDSPESPLVRQATNPQKIVSGARKEIIQLVIHAAILRILVSVFRSPIRILRSLHALIRMRRKVLGDLRITKAAVVDGRYYWDLYAPGYGSRAFKSYIKAAINGRITQVPGLNNQFGNVLIALTKKCALQCEHCFEWDALNKKETLTLADLKSIVESFQNRGTSQIQLTGGEPMSRVDDVIEILKSSKPDTDFWILTSGMNLTTKNAQDLKHAGLTGVVISLDHFEPAQHIKFRGHAKAFAWAEGGARNAIEANLVTALSVCATKAFVNENNLMAYMELAKAWGVSFVQILEPREVGHYMGVDVALEQEHEALLEEFYLRMNYERRYAAFPIVVYHGYHQRRAGCFSAGNWNLYVDTDGDMHACPFCREKTGNVLSDDLDNSLERLRARGCHAFKSYAD